MGEVLDVKFLSLHSFQKTLVSLYSELTRYFLKGSWKCYLTQLIWHLYLSTKVSAGFVHSSACVQLNTLETILLCYPGSVTQHADTQIWTLEGKQRSMCYEKTWANPQDISLKTWAGIWICVLRRAIRKIQLSPSSQIRKIDNSRTQYLLFLKKAWLCHHHFWSSIQSPETPMCAWRICLRI